MSIPMWNCDYADADGHIMLVDNGLIPRRGKGDYQYWSKVVPGDTSETLWHDYLSFEELPKSVDPVSGWNQNTNEPPSTITSTRLERLQTPAYPRLRRANTCRRCGPSILRLITQETSQPVTRGAIRNQPAFDQNGTG